MSTEAREAKKKLLAGLFDLARLAALPEALADYQQLDPAVLARTLLVQINYAHMAANMPPYTFATGSGIFRFATVPGHYMAAP